jgi:hypothetical protein
VDIEKFFDNINHERMMEYIERRIQDAHLLRLISRTLRNSILRTTGETKRNRLGSPQGSPASPILANIYLHYVMDDWFQQNWGHEGRIVRYADDAIFVFSNWTKANEFKRALEDRLIEEGKLKLNMDKSKITLFGNSKAVGDIQFLGFNFYWGRKLNKVKLLRLKTNPQRLSRSIKNFTDWIKMHRNRRKLETLWDMASARIQGHYNYFRLSFNQSKLRHFYWACTRALFKWLNRRSQRRSFTWKKFLDRLKYNPLPKPPLGYELKNITLGIVN